MNVDNTTHEYIDSSVARSYLPALSLENAVELMDRRDTLNDFDRTVIYTHYLIARGDFSSIVDFLELKTADERHRIVNHTMDQTWNGNTLHTCLYWNTGANALNIYRYLHNCGAVPVRDYYEQYPWSMDGVVYICPLRGFNVVPGHDRNPAEFRTTYAEVLRHFGPPLIPPPRAPPSLSTPTLTWSADVGTTPSVPSAVDDLVASCRLHHPYSLYTRNSDGYYGTYAPTCNGCAVGRREAEEHIVVDRIRSYTYALEELWLRGYDDESVIMAQNTAGMLMADIATLESMTRVIVTPIDYAQRMLDIHTAANAVHTAMTNNASLESSRNRLVQQITDSRMSSLHAAPILLASQSRLTNSNMMISETSSIS
jgi:hypothetical protein